jgi:serine protease Do
MTYRSIWTIGGMAALGVVLVALPGPSQTKQEPDEPAAAQLSQRYTQRLERALADLLHNQGQIQRAYRLAQEVTPRILDEERDDAMALLEDQVSILTDLDDGSSWLGVETRDVDADKAKELKLPGERGVLLTNVIPDSPAAQAGLKENDVVTEINGQRIEGALQFRRLIHEIPAGRTVQLGIIRDGRAQNISATLGKAEERRKRILHGPSTHIFTLRDMPKVAPFVWSGELFPGNRARLGIDGEDLGGQLGSYFGAPDGEGILVREVQSGSAAEKGGVKAGDVLIKFNGERLRTIGDLREKLAGLHEQKTVKLGVIRNRGEISVEVTIEPPAKQKLHKLVHGTNI